MIKEIDFTEVYNKKAVDYGHKALASTPNDFVLTVIKDTVSGKTRFVTAFYENGVFWSDASNQAQGIENSSKSYNKETDRHDILNYEWKVIAWTSADID